MIPDLLILLVVVVLAGGVGLWLGIVVLAPRLQRRIDRADTPGAEGPPKEPDARAE